MRRFTLYTFVISLLWLGFLCAVVWIVRPALAHTPGMEPGQVARISYVVSHDLQHFEWVSCVACWVLMSRTRIVRERISLIALALITAALLFQAFALFPTLDLQTASVIENATSVKTWHQQAYAGAEILKALALGVLTAAQIQSFARAVISE